MDSNITEKNVEELEEIIVKQTAKDIKVYNNVECPQHYAGTNIEVIDYIEDKELGYCLGNVIQYVSRAGRKHSEGMTDLEKEIEDLKKAEWYLKRRIYELEKGMK